jgi:prevent-host-death family protein
MERETIGAFEAKTHLSSLLDRAAAGTRFVITKRGRPVAELIPYSQTRESSDLARVVSELRTIRESMSGPVNIVQLRDEGRKR